MYRVFQLLKVRRVLRCALRPRVTVAVFASFAGLASSSIALVSEAIDHKKMSIATAQKSLNRLSIPWVANYGQWDDSAAFRAEGFAGAVWLTKDGKLVHQFNGAKDAYFDNAGDGGIDSRFRQHARVATQSKRKPGWVLTERFVGGKVKQNAIKGVDEQVGKVSYQVGEKNRHANNLATFGQVELGEVFPGVSVALKATNANVEKLFTVEPHRDPKAIRMAIDGAQSLRLGKDGSLIAQTGNGDIAFTPPVAFQEIDGKRADVVVRYTLDAETSQYGFALAAYDKSYSITIDPLLKSTYVGGSGTDQAHALAIHPISGDVYVAGESTSANFPGTTGGAQPTRGGFFEAFVSRFDSTLTARLQSTYLGTATSDEYAHALAIHPVSGAIYVAGYTSSDNFPGTAGGAQAAFGGDIFDAFVSRFDAALTALEQSTYLGGSGSSPFAYDFASALAIHPTSGEVYVAGHTDSTDFPRTAGGAQATNGGDRDAFVARFNSGLTVLLQSTYVGGSASDEAVAIAIHPSSGDIYVAGTTRSADFPGSASGAQPTRGGVQDAFISRFNAALTTLTQSTYLGGIESDPAYALAIHPVSGEIYVAGATLSFDFPGTAGGAQAAIGAGFLDAYVSRFNAELTTLAQSTYLGGSGIQYARALAISPVSGEIYVAGNTNSANFSGVEGGAQPAISGSITPLYNSDAFVSRLNAHLTGRIQSTYLGGSGGIEGATSLAIHPASGEVYVAGITDSTDFPGAAGGAQAVYGGDRDSFISRLSNDLRVCSLDIDGDGAVRTHVDGLLILRSMLGINGVAYTNGVSFSAGATRTSEASIKGFIGAQSLDIDGSTGVDNAATDGLLLLRAMFGMTGIAVTDGATGVGATRTDWASIRTFLNTNCGTNFAQ
jgi:hypothetical protein